MEESQAINITYETLFDILRAEKEKNELQKLEPNFFQHVVDYLKEKLSILEGREGQSELFSAEEKRKTRIQLENIQKILKELYERREKKIINLALDKSKTKSSLIDTSALLKEEYSLFNLLLFMLDSYRENVLMNVLAAKIPVIDKKEEKKEELKPAKAETEAAETNDTILVRFVHAVPKFVGKELEEYGPFEEEDVASLPADIAKILVGKGRAEKIDDK